MTSVPENAHARRDGSASPPLYGLVLAGGKSTRMGRPKWALEYRGEPHALALHRMLAGLCERTFLSIRADQHDPRLAALPHITDRLEGFGPLGGILAAMEAHPEVAWLVVACDLPLLDIATLRRLVGERTTGAVATSYRSPHDEMPEPLCAIYEPKARGRLLQSVELGQRCPRKALMNSTVALIDPPNPEELTNANRPEDYQAALLELTGGQGGER